MEKKLSKTNMWKQKQNQQKRELGFLGNGLRMQEQACVRSLLPRKPKNTKTGQNLKIEILTTYHAF